MDMISGVLRTLRVAKVRAMEAARSRLSGRTIFAMRWFGGFARWGIGAYGTDLNACRRRMDPYEIEEIFASGMCGLITNRMAFGVSTLKMGTHCNGGN